MTKPLKFAVLMLFLSITCLLLKWSWLAIGLSGIAFILTLFFPEEIKKKEDL